MKLLSLFSGIGAFEKALKNIGIEYELVNYCDIDKYAAKAYSLIHSVDENKNLIDVTKINTKDFTESIDMITYGFPCQDISLNGKQKGFVDEDGNLTRSGLFFEAARIISDTKPKFAIAKNVKTLTTKKFAEEFKIVLQTLSDIGYNSYYSVLNAKDFGIPQNRERVFIISIRKDIDCGFTFPEKQILKLKLRDLLEKDVDEKYFLSDKALEYILSSGTKNFYYKPEIDLDVARPLTATMHKMHRAGQDNYVSENFVQTGEKLHIREATKKGYAEAVEGDFVNLQFPNSKTRRGRVGKQVSQTLLCNDSNGVVTNSCRGLRIRKLTPKECFRLMGFCDSDIDILIENGISNTQLYKMAGNSIVVDVLEKIFSELFDKYEA